MRDILFEGKKKDSGEWIRGLYLRRTHPCIEYFRFAEDGVPEPDIAEVIPESVSQYTGIDTLYKPQIGNKLFEGYIVRFMYLPDLQEAVGIICFEEAKFVVKWTHVMVAGSWYKPIDIYGKEMKTDLCESVAYNIQGRIYDNPNFLTNHLPQSSHS